MIAEISNGIYLSLIIYLQFNGVKPDIRTKADMEKKVTMWSLKNIIYQHNYIKKIPRLFYRRINCFSKMAMQTFNFINRGANISSYIIGELADKNELKILKYLFNVTKHFFCESSDTTNIYIHKFLYCNGYYFKDYYLFVNVINQENLTHIKFLALYDMEIKYFLDFMFKSRAEDYCDNCIEDIRYIKIIKTIFLPKLELLMEENIQDGLCIATNYRTIKFVYILFRMTYYHSEYAAYLNNY